MYVARQVWPSRSPGLFLHQKCRSSLRWGVSECELSRSMHLACRLLACVLQSLCARGATGQRPIDQCWRRQARACRRLCVLSAWCLRASEGRGTGSLEYICCEAFLGIASAPGAGSCTALRKCGVVAGANQRTPNALSFGFAASQITLLACKRCERSSSSVGKACGWRSARRGVAKPGR